MAGTKRARTTQSTPRKSQTNTKARRTPNSLVPRSKLRVPSMGQPFPARRKAKLRYCDIVTLTGSETSTLGLTHKLFGANNMYDPDYSAIGHQPRGFDQLMAIYNHYVVNSSVMRVTFVSKNDTAPVSENNAIVGVRLVDDTVVDGDVKECMEAAMGQYTVLPKQPTTRTVSLRYERKKHFPKGGIGLHQGSVSSGPDERQFFMVYQGLVPSGDSNVQDIIAVIDMEFDVEFFELKDLGLS